MRRDGCRGKKKRKEKRKREYGAHLGMCNRRDAGGLPSRVAAVKPVGCPVCPRDLIKARFCARAPATTRTKSPGPFATARSTDHPRGRARALRARVANAYAWCGGGGPLAGVLRAVCGRRCRGVCGCGRWGALTCLIILMRVLARLKGQGDLWKPTPFLSRSESTSSH